MGDTIIVTVTLNCENESTELYELEDACRPLPSDLPEGVTVEDVRAHAK